MHCVHNGEVEVVERTDIGLVVAEGSRRVERSKEAAAVAVVAAAVLAGHEPI